MSLRLFLVAAAVGCLFSAAFAPASARQSEAPVAAPAPGAMRDITSLELSKEMSPGWNLGNSLEATPDETSWGNPAASQKLMDGVKAAGFRTVRIPVSWSAHADGGSVINRAWMARVRQVVDYARKADLYVILNVHWDGGWLQPTYAKQAAADARLAKLWTQIAAAFRDYDDHLLFAGTNEVHVTDQYGPPTPENAKVQNGFNQVFVNAVRATGGNNARRHLVVQGYNTNIDATVADAVLPTDTVPGRLMLEVHYYDPYNFTLNEKSKVWQWGTIATDPAATEPWANESFADAQFEKLKTRFIDKGVPVILGEYAADRRPEIKGADRYRVYWDLYITRSAFEHGVVPVYWDNGATGGHGSGLFDRTTGAPVSPALVREMVNAAH